VVVSVKELLAHTVPPVALTIGTGFIITGIFLTAGHPVALFAVNVYVPALTELTFGITVVSCVDINADGPVQRKETNEVPEPGTAVRVRFSPAHFVREDRVVRVGPLSI
jgi:hypothetical protein